MNWLRRVLNVLRPSTEVAKTSESVQRADRLLRDLRELRRFELIVRRR